MDEQMWLRSFRRVAGSDPDGDERSPGPWHLMHDQWQTWCGKKRSGFPLNTFEHHGEQPEGKVCATCMTARKNDRPRAWRR